MTRGLASTGPAGAETGEDMTLPIAERYTRAAAALPASAMARAGGNIVDGYWLDADRFFFCAEHFDPALGGLVETPSIADVRTRDVTAVIAPAAVAGLLAARTGMAVERMTAGEIRYDMPDPTRLAISFGGRHYLVDAATAAPIGEESAAAVPELYAPDGRHACYVDGYDLWLRDRATGERRPLTRDGAPANGYGRQPETGIDTPSYRRRPFPLAIWSADSRWLLTHRIDERAVPETGMVEHVPPGAGRPALHRFRLAMPGDPRPLITMVAVEAATGCIVAATPFHAALFSPFQRKSTWFSGNERICYLRGDRYDTAVELVELDLASGTERVLVAERAERGYIDLNPLVVDRPNVRTLSVTDEVIWYSERDGWGHLYLYDAGAAAPKAQITRGAWQVREIVHVDLDRRQILFTAGGMDAAADPALRRLCRVRFDGSGLDVLVVCPGDIGVRADLDIAIGQDRPFRAVGAPVGAAADGRHLVMRRGNLIDGAETVILDPADGSAFAIAACRPAAAERANPPRLFEVLAADGVTRLHGVLVLPPDHDETLRYPVIDLIYPGPQLSLPPRGHGTRTMALARALAALGLAVVVTDSRGVALRSRTVHQAGYGDQFEPQLTDHVAVIGQLCDRHPFLDRDRVGIIGSSAGGGAAARAMFTHGDLYKAGVAVCGSHDSLHYPAGWMDRYVGVVAPEAAAQHRNATFAHQLQGRLFLIHGEMDENVHLASTLTVVDALVRANKDFELLVVPNEGHTLLSTSGYVARRVFDFFVRTLRGDNPPAGFAIEFDPRDIAAMERQQARDAIG